MFQFPTVQSFSCIQLFGTPWTAACQASLSTTNFWSLHKLMSIKSVMPFNHLILCCPLLLLPQSFPASVFFNESVLHIRWPKYWSFSISISPCNEYSELISLGMTGLISLKSKGLLRVISNSWKASNLWYSAFFIVQLLHPYWKMQFWQYRSSLAKSSLCFLILLSKFVIAFLPRSESLLIACLQSLSAVILEPKKRGTHVYLWQIHFDIWQN